MLRALAPLLIFLLLGLAFAIGLQKDPRSLTSELIDKPFPDFQLTNLYDETQSINEDIVQGQVSLVNVFGSWCVACSAEHPLLIELAKTINVIGINWRDEREKGKAWLEKRGNPYSKVIFDDESLLAIQLGITGAPETYITDKMGKIRYKHVGIITPEIWAQTLHPIVKRLEAN